MTTTPDGKMHFWRNIDKRTFTAVVLLEKSHFCASELKEIALVYIPEILKNDNISRISCYTEDTTGLGFVGR